jgi:YegS/Rv2252/BmrU family lipid kinase
MVTIFINGKAGTASGFRDGDGLAGLIEDRIPDAEIVYTDGGTDVTGLARKAVERGSRMVVAGGGDGTLNAVASALVGSETPLGILPMGTLNHFARDVGIPLDLEKAVEALVSGGPISVDVGEVNGQPFLNNSGLGLYPVIVHMRELRQGHAVSKWPAAIWATIKALSHYERLAIRVTVDGDQLLRRTPIVFVGNNEYSIEGAGLPSRTTLDDGRLCVYIPHHQGRWRLIWFSLKSLFTPTRPQKGFDAFLTTECRIETRHRHLKISLDGEVKGMSTPLDYRIRPGALRVMVPRQEGPGT